MNNILLCNLEEIPDKKFEVLGFVSGMDYERYSTDPVTEKVMKQAEQLGADAIINLKFDVTSHNQMALLILSGTAVKFVE